MVGQSHFQLHLCLCGLLLNEPNIQCFNVKSGLRSNHKRTKCSRKKLKLHAIRAIAWFLHKVYLVLKSNDPLRWKSCLNYDLFNLSNKNNQFGVPNFPLIWIKSKHFGVSCIQIALELANNLTRFQRNKPSPWNKRWSSDSFIYWASLPICFE